MSTPKNRKRGTCQDCSATTNDPRTTRCKPCSRLAAMWPNGIPAHNPATEKPCTRCKGVFPLEQFPRLHRPNDTRRHWCAGCWRTTLDMHAESERKQREKKAATRPLRPPREPKPKLGATRPGVAEQLWPTQLPAIVAPYTCYTRDCQERTVMPGHCYTCATKDRPCARPRSIFRPDERQAVPATA